MWVRVLSISRAFDKNVATGSIIFLENSLIYFNENKNLFFKYCWKL